MKIKWSKRIDWKKNRLEEIKNYHYLIAGLIDGDDLMEKLKDCRRKTLEERQQLKKQLKNKDPSCCIF